MEKKGQLMSEPFVWIFALIVGALILIWGIKTVMDLKETADTVDLGQFKTKIETIAKSMKNQGEGSSEIVPVKVGAKVKFVCLSNTEATAISCKAKGKDGTLKDCPGGAAALDPALELRMKSAKNTDNMWILPFGSSKKDSFKILYITPIAGANPICYQNGVASIEMETRDTFVEVK